MNSETMDKVKRAGFSEEEATALINFTKVMASKPLKEFLLHYVNETAAEMGIDENSKKEKQKVRLYKKIVGKISRLDVSEFTGYQEIKFDDRSGKEWRLRYQVAMVPKDHEMVLHVPDMKDKQNAIKQMFFYMDKLVDMSMQYYLTMVQQSRIISDLAEFFPETDVTQMKMNGINRTMYLDEDFGKRLGILVYYVDDNGDLLRVNESEEK